MKVGNNDVKGLFIYDIGLSFSESDLILSNGIIYHVHTNFESRNEENDIKNYCISYLEKNQYSESNPGGILTHSSFFNILNSTLAGVTDNGIESKVISDMDELNEIKVTSIYNVTFGNSKYIVRSYKLDGQSIVIQERIQYEGLDEGKFALTLLKINSGSSELISGVTTFTDITELTKLLNKYRRTINAIYNSKVYLYHKSLGDSKEFNIDSNSNNILIQLNISRVIDDLTEMKTLWFDLTELNAVNISDSNDEYDITMNKIITRDESINITITNSGNWKLHSVLSSSPFIETENN